MLLGCILGWTGCVIQQRAFSVGLDLDPAGYSREVRILNDFKSYPFAIALSAHRPAKVKVAPRSSGTIRYGSIFAGNGPRSETILALVEEPGKSPRLYVDLNQNDDLTDDGDGSWQISEQLPKGVTGYDSILSFRVSWGTKNYEESWGQYSLKLFMSEPGGQLFASVESARKGSFVRNGNNIAVLVVEHQGDAIYQARPGQKRPIWICVDLNSDGVFQQDGDQAERFEPGKPLKMFGTSWTASLDVSGKTLTFRPYVGK